MKNLVTILEEKIMQSLLNESKIYDLEQIFRDLLNHWQKENGESDYEPTLSDLLGDISGWTEKGADPISSLTPYYLASEARKKWCQNEFPKRAEEYIANFLQKMQS